MQNFTEVCLEVNKNKTTIDNQPIIPTIVTILNHYCYYLGPA